MLKLIGGTASVDDTMSQADPMTMIAELQRSRWCWRLLALSLLALVVVLFLIVASVTVVGWGRARSEQMTTTDVVPPHGQVGGSVFTMGTLDTPDKDKATRLVRLPVMPAANLKEKKLEAGTHAILQLGVIRQGALVVAGIDKFGGAERIGIDGLDAPRTKDKGE